LENLDYNDYACGSHLLDDELFLSRCQVDTPVDVVDFFWGLLEQYRDNAGVTADLGAGDGRFAKSSAYRSYQGFEIDESRLISKALPQNARIRIQCAFSVSTSTFDTCIGNPPYVKHHDIDNVWHKRVAAQLRKSTGVNVKGTANLFSLFLLQGLAITKNDGLVAQIIPYEWITRPSTAPIRDYIKRNGWSVSAYRFKASVFPRVLTTACITIIDKRNSDGKWSYFEIGDDMAIKPVSRPTGSRYNVLSYTKRGENNFAQRGLSPGGNAVFCLTEGERLHYGLKKEIDVIPCLVSLKRLPDSQRALNKRSFNKYFVQPGERCWLIKNTTEPSKALRGYLDSVPVERRSNYTCRRQTPWWKYNMPSIPDIVYNPGFVKRAPQFIDNQVGAVAVGSVFGIHNVRGISKLSLIDQLLAFEFRSRLISYAKILRRVEVNQMNTVINHIINRTE